MVLATVVTSARRDQSAISAPPSLPSTSATRPLPPSGKAAMSPGSTPSVTKSTVPGCASSASSSSASASAFEALRPGSGMIEGSSASRNGCSTVGSSVSGITRCAEPA